MKHNTEILLPDPFNQGIEILVGYDFDKTNSFYSEEGNSGTLVEEMVYTELTSVEVIVKGVGIDILPMMNDLQKKHIISLLNYES